MNVLGEVGDERARQQSRWGADHDQGHSWPEWRHLMGLRIALVGPQFNDEQVARRRRALIELAALAIAAIEASTSCYRCDFELATTTCSDCSGPLCGPCSTDGDLSCGTTICGACGSPTDRDIDGEGSYIHRRCR